MLASSINLNEPTFHELVEVYESYRLDGEPDSPQIPFNDLTENERRVWMDGLRGMIRMIGGRHESIGWISLKPERSEYNLGFGLFPQFRGRGLMSLVLPVIMDKVASEMSPPRFTAAVRSGNARAIRVLQNTGFEHTGSMVKFDARYETYVYTRISE